jgi:hypothetical protein
VRRTARRERESIGWIAFLPASVYEEVVVSPARVARFPQAVELGSSRGAVSLDTLRRVDFHARRERRFMRLSLLIVATLVSVPRTVGADCPVTKVETARVLVAPPSACAQNRAARSQLEALKASLRSINQPDVVKPLQVFIQVSATGQILPVDRNAGFPPLRRGGGGDSEGGVLAGARPVVLADRRS